MAGFLTDEWLSDLAGAAAAVVVAPEVALVVQQVIGLEADEVAYSLHLAEGRLTVRPGHAIAPDVTLRQDATTARLIHDGRLSAQTAFLDGRMRLSGDVAALLAAASALADLDDVFAQVRA